MTEATRRRTPGERHGPMSGRQAEAARNDQRILDSARAVFVRDPGAPITAVAKLAGVGISALYTRFASKDELLRQLCTDGMLTFNARTEQALEQLASGADHWQVLSAYMHDLTDADTSSLTLALAGKFAPTPEMFELGARSGVLLQELFGQVRDVLRPGVVSHDLSRTFELVAAVTAATPERSRELRHRYLTAMLDGLRAADRGDLPGPPPTFQEISDRWQPAG
ncbi:MAG TPA: TetR/AcrR family transcriptional regulator [Streptosporangiaceae bacterium]|nr:TetR/AcrR family transcriptional regulator [Streptosporangiaceae bacterium]